MTIFLLSLGLFSLSFLMESTSLNNPTPKEISNGYIQQLND